MYEPILCPKTEKVWSENLFTKKFDTSMRSFTTKFQPFCFANTPMGSDAVILLP